MKYRVTGGSLNVRQEPNTNAPIIHILADGEIITPGKEAKGWRKYGSGYVMAKWLEPAPEEEEAPAPAEDKTAEAIEEAAKDIKKAAKEVKAASKKTTRKKADK